MKPKNYLLLAFLLLAQFTSSQNFNKEIYLLDSKTKESIDFATLVINESKLAFTSDENGRILMSYPSLLSNEKATLQHLSYESQIIALNVQEDTIYLQSKDYLLAALEINALSAKQLVLDAVGKISVNYSFSENILPGLYEQVHKENGKYVRFIQAQLQLKMAGYDPKFSLVQEESFKVEALRKSYVYERNGDKHGDHLVDLFADNPLQYLDRHLLNPKNIELYQWQYLEQEMGQTVVYFQNKYWNDPVNLSGKIWINPLDKGIIHIEIYQQPNAKSLEENKSSRKLINGWYEASYEKQNEYYELVSCKKWYNHELRNRLNPKEIDFIVEEYFHWEKRPEFKFKDSEKFFKNSNLYAIELPYHKENWNDVKIDSLMRIDLEGKHSLEHQFLFP